MDGFELELILIHLVLMFPLYMIAWMIVCGDFPRRNGG